MDLRRLVPLALAVGVATPAAADPPPDPVQVVRDVYDGTWQALYDACSVDLCVPSPHQYDPLICPLVASFTPGVPPADVVVDQSGDVEAGGRKVHDCPPYDGP